MSLTKPEKIAAMLVGNIGRDVVLAVEESLTAAAARGCAGATELELGHRAHAMGQLRHFHMNQAFCQALTLAGADPTPIRGNSIVVGRTGIFMLSRFNLSNGVWNNGRRSITRRQLSEANSAIELAVRPDLFGTEEPVTKATAFFVASFSGSLSDRPEAPLSIDIAVPDKEMKSWLFRESVPAFLKRYDAVPAQIDMAKPRLKNGALKKKDQGK